MSSAASMNARAKGWDSWREVSKHVHLHAGEVQLRAVMRGEAHLTLRDLAAFMAVFPNLMAGPTLARRLHARNQAP